MINPDAIERRIAEAIDQGRATTPRSFYETANGLWIIRNTLQKTNTETSLYTSEGDFTHFISLTKTLKGQGQSYNSIDILDEGDNQMWEAKELISPKGRRRFEILWGPNNDYSIMAGSGILPDTGLIRVDQFIKPEQILSVNRYLLLAHRRTPIEAAAA